MNLFQHLNERLVGVVADLVSDGLLPQGVETSRIAVEPPRDPSHGDITTNVAMIFAKPAKMKPRDLANVLAERLGRLDSVSDCVVAGPGFINIRLIDGFWHDRLVEILAAGTAYGDSSVGGGEPVNVEYVSANPTGPLHVGHGRGAVVGDALASLLEKAGFNVVREYYINDAGGQVDKLADAVHWRYLQSLGDRVPGAVLEAFVDETSLEYRGRLSGQRR